MYIFDQLKDEYAALWGKMALLDGRRGEFTLVAKRLLANLPKYANVSKATGVPACVIAVIHERESDSDFETYLGNGEPLSHITHLQPGGRGPFATFDAGAIDALVFDGLNHVPRWTTERALYELELWNGFGYRIYHREPTPYLWGGTSIQQPGKYVGDGKFDPNVTDEQLGCAGMLAMLFALDPTLTLPRESSSATLPTPAPTVAPPASQPLPTTATAPPPSPSSDKTPLPPPPPPTPQPVSAPIPTSPAPVSTAPSPPAAPPQISPPPTSPPPDPPIPPQYLWARLAAIFAAFFNGDKA